MIAISIGRVLRAGAFLGLLATASVGFAKERVTEEISRTFKLTADGRISLENVNGNVKIQTWDQAEVSMKAVKKGDSKESLDAVTIEVDSKEDRLSVKTKLPEGRKRKKGNSVEVDYSLMVPRGVNLKGVSSVNGNVEIQGVTGRIEASTVNGNLKAQALANKATLSSVNGKVEAGFADLPKDGEIKISTVNGRVSVGLPEKPNAQISASSINGGISNAYDLPVKKNFPIGRELKAQIGEGGVELDLSSVNGGIEIVRADAK